MANHAPKVLVTQRALTQRLDRRLRRDGRRLRASRGRGPAEWFVVDATRRRVVKHDVDLQALAAELGVLRPYETLAWVQSGRRHVASTAATFHN